MDAQNLKARAKRGLNYNFDADANKNLEYVTWLNWISLKFKD